MAFIVHLPNEIISTIIAYLDPCDQYQCTFVNQQFYTTANPFIWHTPRMDPESFFDTLAHTRHSIFIGQSIRNIDLLDFVWTDAHLFLLMNHTPHLVDLLIVGGHGDDGQLTDNSLSQLGHSFPQLKSLRYHCVTMEGKSINVSISALAPVASHLETLHLSGCVINTHHDVQRLLNDFSLLTDVSIRCIDVGDCTPFLAHSSHSWPNLRRLCLDPCPTINDTMMVEWIESHPLLDTLQLLQCHDGLTNITLNAIMNYLKDIIIHVDLSGNPRFDSWTVRYLVENCKQLTHVGLEECEIEWDHFDYVLHEDFDGRCRDNDNDPMYLRFLDFDATNDIREDMTIICRFALFD